MFAIILIIICFNGIQCEDICDAIKPNGVYKGVMPYLYFKPLLFYDYYMFTNGKQWKIDIIYDTINNNSAEIKHNETSIESINTSIAYTGNR